MAASVINQGDASVLRDTTEDFVSKVIRYLPFYNLAQNPSNFFSIIWHIHRVIFICTPKSSDNNSKKRQEQATRSGKTKTTTECFFRHAD